MLMVVSMYLTGNKECLTIVLFKKWCAFQNIFIRESKNEHKTIEKVEMLKMPSVNPFLTDIHKTSKICYGKLA